jgi:hypothetical protein
MKEWAAVELKLSPPVKIRSSNNVRRRQRIKVTTLLAGGI